MVDFDLMFDQQLEQQKDRLSSVLQAQQSSSGLPSSLFERRRLDRMLERLLRECV